MQIIIDNLFNIGNTVYYILPDSGQGFILDIRYHVKANSYEYLITFGRLNSDCVWCDEEELSDAPNF